MAKPFAMVIGKPISQSLSPRLHLAAYQHIGLDWDFQAIEVARGQAADFLRSLDKNCRGVAVTMPNKQSIFPALERIEGLAKVTKVVNTVVPASGFLSGFNTDVYGIVAALRTHVRPGSPAVVFGGGATGTSALAALTELGCSPITVISRNPYTSNAYQASLLMGIEPKFLTWGTEQAHLAITQAETLVSTLPASAAEEIPALPISEKATVLECAYYPWPTPVAARAEKAGAKVVAGTWMLIHQAIAQIKLFTSHEVPVSVLAAAIQEHLPTEP